MQLFGFVRSKAGHWTRRKVITSREKYAKVPNLGRRSWVVNPGGDEHPAFSIDDQSPVVVAHVERLEETRGTRADEHQEECQEPQIHPSFPQAPFPLLPPHLPQEISDLRDLLTQDERYPSALRGQRRENYPPQRHGAQFPMAKLGSSWEMDDLSLHPLPPEGVTL